MIQDVFSFLARAEDFLWGYAGFIVLGLGLYLTFSSRFMQFFRFPAIVRNFVQGFSSSQVGPNLHPIRAFFASIGGSLGIGNVIAVSAAIQLGGPGTLVWIWITALISSIVKYAEVYIGMATRKKLPDGSMKGGPMYFLKEAFNGASWPVILFCVLLCIYGVEVYQFGVVTSMTATALGVSKWVTALLFLAIVITVERGGFHRVGLIASMVIPFIVAVYVTMGSYILFVNAHLLPAVFADIFRSAFSVRAAEGAFLGGSMLLAISHGVRRGCYSTDIGIGYASIVHSSSAATHPARQASLLIFEIIVDTFFVCTMSVLLVLVTGTWKQELGDLFFVQQALAQYFPHMEYFMPFLIFLLGYSVVTTYFSSGMYTAQFLFPTWGRCFYYCYAIVAFLACTFLDNRQALSIMSLTGFSLLVLNSVGIWRLRRLIAFDITPKATVPDPVVEIAP